ncbi:15102_t:CDS:2, partial [Funneliformis geosporum]
EQNLDDLDNKLDENIKSKNNCNKNTKGKTKSEETYKESSKFLPFCHKYNLHEASPTLSLN